MKKFLKYIFTPIKVENNIKSGWALLFPPPQYEERNLYEFAERGISIKAFVNLKKITFKSQMFKLKKCKNIYKKSLRMVNLACSTFFGLYLRLTLTLMSPPPTLNYENVLSWKMIRILGEIYIANNKYYINLHIFGGKYQDHYVLDEFSVHAYVY